MNTVGNPTRATIFADVLVLWVALFPTLLFVKSTASSNSIIAAAYLTAIVYAAARLCFTPLKTMLANMFRQDKRYWMWAALLLAATFVSAAYSVNTLTTLRHACLLSGTVVIGLYLGCQYSSSSLFKLLIIALVPTALLSVFLCATDPGTAIMHSPAFHQLHEGRWRGVFTHKNWLGVYMGLLSIVLATNVLTQRVRSAAYSIILLVALLVTLLLVLKAESTTALIAMTLSFSAIICASLFVKAHEKRLWKISAGLLVLPILSACLLDNSTLLNATPVAEKTMAKSNPGFSRDRTMSGRVPHWAHVQDAIKTKPLQGFGYETFWHTDDAQLIHQKNQWVTGQAHSGWLDAILDLGVPVGLLVILWMLWTFQRMILLASRNRAFVAPAAVLLYMFIANCTESLLPNHSGLLFVLMIALAVVASRQISDAGRQKPNAV